MGRPRIVGEIRKPVLELMPPSATRPHAWLSPDAAKRYKATCATRETFDVYLSSLAENKILEQSMNAAPKMLEVMGLLLGEVRSWKGEIYTIVRDVGTTDLKNSPAKVKFDPEALPRLFADLDRADFDYVVVGWYHSHPGHTCFLSRTDMRTQKAMFSQSFHCAIVIDPLNREIEAFKLRGDGYIGVPFTIVDGGFPRMRRLRTLGGGQVGQALQ
ncbi:MAG: Mov34/MPN/PAD-1 family protein [Thermoplasmata archaeon]|nr:Mov34/MPN/PAD-1 family protein [Thermoplasmata archaeon]